MAYYRYEFENGCKYPNTGIVCGISEVFADDDDLAFKLITPFEDELDFPRVSNQVEGFYDSYCFFTEAGNEKFKTTIFLIDQFAKRRGVKMKCTIIVDEKQYRKIYEDEYQVLLVVPNYH